MCGGGYREISAAAVDPDPHKGERQEAEPSLHSALGYRDYATHTDDWDPRGRNHGQASRRFARGRALTWSYATWRMEILKAGLTTIGGSLAREVARGRLTQQQADEARARIVTATTMDALFASPLIIEAATERFDVKAQIFRDLGPRSAGRDDPGLEYQFDLDYEARCGDPAAGAGNRDALLQSGAGDEAGRDHPGTGDLAGYL